MFLIHRFACSRRVYETLIVSKLLNRYLENNNFIYILITDYAHTSVELRWTSTKWSHCTYTYARYTQEQNLLHHRTTSFSTRTTQPVITIFTFTRPSRCLWIARPFIRSDATVRLVPGRPPNGSQSNLIVLPGDLHSVPGF